MHPTTPFPTEIPTLRGPGLTLRALTEADIPAWFARATDADAADLAGDPVPGSMAQGAEWLQRHRDRFRRRLGLQWAVVPDEARGSVGSAGLRLIEAVPGTADLGFVIARARWGQGLATAAGRLVIGHAFGPLGLSLLRAEVLCRNPASQRVLAKLGFRVAAALPDPDDPREDCCLWHLPRADHAASLTSP